MENALRGVLGYKGERGYSAYEVAVKNGFIGSEKDWLSSLGTSSHFKEEKEIHIATQDQASFDIPSNYTDNSYITVFVNGFRLNQNEYTLDLDTNKINLVEALDEGAVVELVILTMSTNELPILENMTSGATDETVLSSKCVFDNLTINVKSFGAKGDGITDDTEAIQNAIDAANQKNRKVYMPIGTYLISNSILLNGCTLLGETSNIFNQAGTVILCANNTFTAIKQGSVSSADIMFNISDILVKNASIGYEINYAINSKFERLYADSCDIAYKLGDSSCVGSMFCEFNNLYSQNCRVGIESNSNQYFNNNRFNNGYIQGNDYAMKLAVSGGYGAVGNVFNNVEFKSLNGRGVILTSVINNTFNSCYFECGGNVVRTTNYCTYTLKNCTYGLFKASNTNNDKNVIYSEGGVLINIDNGVVFLTTEYANINFYGTANIDTYENITVTKAISKNGSATGFNFFANNIKEIQYKQEEQVTITDTITAKGNSTTEVSFTYPKEFSADPNVVIVTMRGASGISNGLTYIVSNRTAKGGKISVHNAISSDKSISFSIYAKII
jgi:hypothetical protein